MPDHAAFLGTTDLLVEVPDHLLEQISASLEEVVEKEGATIFQEGEPGDAVYLIEDGTLSIESNGIQVVKLGRGECVGEFALVDDGPRSASAVAATDVSLLKWKREDFQKALLSSLEVASGICKVLTGRLRRDVHVRVQSVLEQERWRQDLKRANEIQVGMLPEGDYSTECMEISGYSRPAAVVGGDYFDYVRFGEGKLGLIVGDVTEHGFYSGLFVAMAKSCLHTQGRIDHAPEKVMAAMNRTLFMSIQAGLLMTCCYALIDCPRRKLVYTNAGHPYPYHYRRSTGQLEQLVSTNMLLGVPGFEDLPYKTQERVWEPGDLLLMYTDGIAEAEDLRGNMFGTDPLEETLLQNKDESPSRIKDSILEAFGNHCLETDQEDDVTLVVAKAL